MQSSVLGVIGSLLLLLSIPAAGQQPQVGQKPADFTLPSAKGPERQLSEFMGKGPVALVVLRGFPGYQCPFCQRQVQEFLSAAEGFAALGVQVVFVYPGPPDAAAAKAGEFLTGKEFPSNYHMLLDPGYRFTLQYGLRWDAPKETAYPATFLMDANGVVFYSQVAKLHGGRTSAATILGYFKQTAPKK